VNLVGAIRLGRVLNGTERYGPSLKKNSRRTEQFSI
jgi:hypothetical protein